MMRALFAGVTGLRSHQTKMDVIGNNIANVNTLGFKKSAANFADLYSETTSAASAPTGNKGGTNSNQIGLGVACNAIVVKHTPGAPSYTGNTLDLAISGDGFFTVRTGANGEVAYTRAGNLSVSSNGSLVTSAGYFVQTFNSVYQQGNIGTYTSSGLNGASATGFNSFNFDPNEVEVQRASSGTYTMSLSGTNKVNVYKNGVLFQENLDILDQDGNQLTEAGEFLPNTTYRVNLPGLGSISFRTDGHALSTTGIKSNSNYTNITVNGAPDTTAGKKLAEYLPAGEYKVASNGTGGYEIQVGKLPESFLEGFANGNNTQVIRNSSNEVVARVSKVPRTVQGSDGTTTTVDAYVLEVPKSNVNKTDEGWADNADNWTNGLGLSYKGYPVGEGKPGENGAAGTETGYGYRTGTPGTLLASTTYTLNTPLGNITFTTAADQPVTNPLAQGAESDSSFSDMFTKVSFNVSTQTTEGSGTNYNTGLSYLSSMLQNATISITNNDGFHSGPAMGDMVIDQDMYENVMVNDAGAVVAQLKVDSVYDPLTGEIRPMQPGDANNEALTKLGAGESVIVGYLAMANFANAEGLDKIGTNLYATTANSGVPMYGIAGEDGFGSIVGSSLEMSNVDLSEEMVNMITTQRGFQANSRIITVTDTMLEELINLKR